MLQILIIPAILLLIGYKIAVVPERIALVMAFVPVIFTYAYNQFGIITGLAFWINEAWSIRWSLTITIRFLAGILVPVNFFPFWLQKISFFLPFQHLAYTPISIIQGNMDVATGLTSLVILTGWTMVVMAFRTWQWQKGYIRYESTGQ